VSTVSAAIICAKEKIKNGSHNPAVSQRKGVMVGANIPAKRPRLAAIPEADPLMVVGYDSGV
jgi:hypothetical protein